MDLHHVTECNEKARHNGRGFFLCGGTRYMPNHDECYAMVVDHDSKPRRNTSHEPPVPSSFQLTLNHYNFMSEQQWEVKKMVPLCNGPDRAKACDIAIMRRGPVPKRYEEIEDHLAITLAAERIERFGGSVGVCLRTLLLPDADRTKS